MESFNRFILAMKMVGLDRFNGEVKIGQGAQALVLTLPVLV